MRLSSRQWVAAYANSGSARTSTAEASWGIGDVVYPAKASMHTPASVHHPMSSQPRIPLRSGVCELASQYCNAVGAADACPFMIGDHVWGDIGANTHDTTGAKTKELGAYAQLAAAIDTQRARARPRRRRAGGMGS